MRFLCRLLWLVLQLWTVGCKYKGRQKGPSKLLTAPFKFFEVKVGNLDTTTGPADGNFTIRTKSSWAPLGAERFEELVNESFYDGLVVYKVVPNPATDPKSSRAKLVGMWGIAQFGVNLDKSKMRQWTALTPPGDRHPPRQKKNKRGRIAFAPGSMEHPSGTEVLINLVYNKRLKRMPFGEVVGEEGMKVVDRFYSEYSKLGGANPGKPPARHDIEEEGEKLLNRDYPKLTVIKSIRLIHNPHPEHHKAAVEAEVKDEQEDIESDMKFWVILGVCVTLALCCLCRLALEFKSSLAEIPDYSSRSGGRRLEMTRMGRSSQGPLE